MTEKNPVPTDWGLDWGDLWLFLGEERSDHSRLTRVMYRFHITRETALEWLAGLRQWEQGANR